MLSYLFDEIEMQLLLITKTTFHRQIKDALRICPSLSKKFLAISQPVILYEELPIIETIVIKFGPTRRLTDQPDEPAIEPDRFAN